MAKNTDMYIKGDQNITVPAHLNFGKFILDRLLMIDENEIAFINTETSEKLTYHDVTQYAVDLAVLLTKLGIGRGDLVLLGCERRISFIPTALAIIFTGATYLPLEAKCGRAILKHKLSISKPDYIICTDMFWSINGDILKDLEYVKKFIALEQIPATAVQVKSMMTVKNDVRRFEPAVVQGQCDVAVILNSSGTTGPSKNVELTHLNCILHSLVPDYFKEKSFKRAFVGSAWFHNYCMFITLRLLTLGKTIVSVSNIKPEVVLPCLKDFQVDVAFTTPMLINWLAKVEDSNFSVKNLKMIYSRSCPLHHILIQKIKQKFPEIEIIMQGYGMTEAGEPTSECWGTKGLKPGSIGQLSPCVTVKVVNHKTDEVVGHHEQGEIRLKGPVLMKRYTGIDPSEYLDDEGFFKTGDLGYYDHDRYFYIAGRLKEVISYCGSDISVTELETVLLLHPAVREAGVVGKPDEVCNELPTAFVVKEPGSKVTEQELVDFVSAEMPEYSELKGGVIFIPEMPKNSNGKILRRQLKEMLVEDRKD